MSSCVSHKLTANPPSGSLLSWASQRPPTTELPIIGITGEVLAYAGLSPDLIQRILDRLEALPQAQRQQAQALLARLLL